MTEKSKDQLRDHVERQLADKGSLLTFSPMVKARYEEETGTARCRHLVICGLFALALYRGLSSNGTENLHKDFTARHRGRRFSDRVEA